MHVDLYQGCIANAGEALHLPSLDYEDVPRTGLGLLAIHRPESTPLSHELHLVIGMAVRTGSLAGEGAEEEDGDPDVAVIGPLALRRRQDRQ